jgi:hypothetical protein
MFSVSVCNLNNITLQLNGALIISNTIKLWPQKGGGACLYFCNSTGITVRYGEIRFYFYFYFECSGTKDSYIDGQGWMWWVKTFFDKNDYRPYLVHMQHVQNIEVRCSFPLPYMKHFDSTFRWTICTCATHHCGTCGWTM